MKSILILLCLLFAIYPVYPQSKDALKKLVKTEKEFAKTAAEKGSRHAFLAFLADDGVLFQPGAVNGKEFWEARPKSPALLSWNPVWADVSSNGKLGYTTGDWEFRPKGKDDKPVAFGQYITLWKLQSDGKFKAVLDIGITHAKPESVETDWKSPNRRDTSKDSKKLKGSPKLVTSEFGRYLAEDVRLYRDGSLPFVGRKDALAETKREKTARQNAKVLKENCFRSGDLGFCYGIIERTKNDSKTEKGNLMQISRFRKGKWRIAIDVFIVIPGD